MRLNILLASLFLLVACGSKEVFHSQVKFSGNEWAKDSIVEFAVQITDTVQSYNLSLEITNTDDYPYANLYLFTNIVLPSRQYLRDTVEFMLAMPDGEWIGSGVNGYSNEFLIRQNIRFPEVGTYVFSFEQAMRCHNANCSVQGISSISLSLNKN